jgi:hypothetical protein
MKPTSQESKDESSSLEPAKLPKPDKNLAVSYNSVKLVNTPGVILFGIHAFYGKNSFCNFSKEIEIKMRDFTLKCDFKHIEHSLIKGLYVKTMVCTGTFTDKQNLNMQIFRRHTLDFVGLKIADSDQLIFIKFLEKYITFNTLRSISLPRLTDENLCLASDWVTGRSDVALFDYDADPNNKVQLQICKLTQKAVCKKASPKYDPSGTIITGHPNIVFKKGIVEYKESKYDIDQNLVVAVFYPEQNTFELKTLNEFENIEARIDQLQTLKSKAGKLKNLKITGDFEFVDIAFTLNILDLSDLIVTNEKINAFLDFLVKQKVAILTIPKLDAFVFEDVYKKVMEIKNLTTVHIKHSDKVPKLRDLKQVLNYDINLRANANPIDQIKKKYKIDDDKKE